MPTPSITKPPAINRGTGETSGTAFVSIDGSLKVDICAGRGRVVADKDQVGPDVRTGLSFWRNECGVVLEIPFQQLFARRTKLVPVTEHRQFVIDHPFTDRIISSLFIG